MLSIQCIWSRSGRAAVLQVQNFKFLKEMGLKKPGFLPDFDFGKVRYRSHCRVIITRATWWYISTFHFALQEKRKAVLDRFYTSFDAQVLCCLLASCVPCLSGNERSRAE